MAKESAYSLLVRLITTKKEMIFQVEDLEQGQQASAHVVMRARVRMKSKTTLARRNIKLVLQLPTLLATTVSDVPTKVAHWVGVMETTSGERMVALVSRRQ